MKIHQLPLGTRFEYEGTEYVKSGPMTGTGPSGQRLIPKYAVLKPIGMDAPAAKAELPSAVARDRVLQAFARFHDRCSTLVPAEHRQALDAAREAFLADLG
jgi:hypothetical protein